MTTLRALLIFLFCQFEDYRTVGRNGAVRQMLRQA